MILDKALELGKLIAQSEEFKNMQSTEAAVQQDAAAGQLVKELQEVQQSYQRMQMTGQQLTPEDVQKIRDTEKKATDNPLVAAYYQANMKFYDLVKHVNDKIEEGISGKAPAQSC